jgi:hypothetical protein
VDTVCIGLAQPQKIRGVRRCDPAVGAAPPAYVLRDRGGEAGAQGALGRQKIRGAIMEAIGRM